MVRSVPQAMSAHACRIPSTATDNMLINDLLGLFLHLLAQGLWGASGLLTAVAEVQSAACVENLRLTSAAAR